MKRFSGAVWSVVVAAGLQFVMLACQPENRFVIEGKVPDNSFDGEWIYLVPLVNAPIERVDSTVIKKGAFRFEGRVEAPEVYIIRTRPLLRLSLQELLVIKESGHTNVFIGNESYAGGTAMNDSLQAWKENKEFFDREYSVLSNNLKAADKSRHPDIKNRMDSLNAVKNTYHFNFARNNKNNVVGEMVIRMMGASFTKEQKKELGID